MQYGTRQHDIVCLSSQSWDEPMWTNKQHIMSRLAREHRVLHVDYGAQPLPAYIKKRAGQRLADLAHPARLLTDGVVWRGGTLWTADHWLPLAAWALPKDARLRDYLWHDVKLKFVESFARDHAEHDPIAWVYHPSYGDAVERMPRKLLVYDCVDNYAAFPKYKDKAWLVEREQRLCERADLVFCTSEPLYELRRKHNPENTFLVHNVGDAEHFNKVLDPGTAVPDELLAIRERGPIIGFVGAVSNYKLNLDWLRAMARAKPDYQIVLIGPVGMSDPETNVDELQRIPNIHLLGVRSYQALPNYIKGFDVSVIPYRINSYTESVFPIKFFEFLASGKPVVISPLPSVSAFFGDVLVAQDSDEFIAHCEAVLGGAEQDLTRQSHRLGLAAEHSWPKRIGEIMGHIERKLDDKGVL